MHNGYDLSELWLPPPLQKLSVAVQLNESSKGTVVANYTERSVRNKVRKCKKKYYTIAYQNYVEILVLL